MNDALNVFVASPLPPELLDNVFNNVALETTPEERAPTALALSQVCRSFRRAALECPSLWTGLCRRSGCPTLEFVETCIKRSKKEPLDIVVYFYKMVTEDSDEIVVVDKILEQVLPYRGRWRSCSWKFVDEDAPDDDLAFHIDSNYQWWPDEVVTPLLEDFYISEWPMDDDFLHFQDFLDNFENVDWRAPKIRTVAIRNSKLDAFPYSISTQLHSLRINYTDESLFRHIQTLQEVLHGMASLTTFQLSLIRCDFDKALDNTIVLPSIKFLDIELLDCSKSGSQTQILWKVTRSFYFPNVVELKVTLDFGVGEASDRLMKWKKYNDGLYSLFAPHPEFFFRYPSLEVLDITILPRGDQSRQSDEVPPPIFLFSPSFVPSLKHLRIRTGCYLKLQGSVGEYKKSHPPHFEHGNESVELALETVTFDLPRVDDIVSWMTQLAKMMQDMACWDQFSALTVIRDGEAAVIARDEVESWCKGVEDRSKKAKRRTGKSGKR